MSKIKVLKKTAGKLRRQASAYFKKPAIVPVRDRSLLQKIKPDSLLFYYGNTYSQRGQDGILAEIFRRLNFQGPKTFVEFGAWDGIHLSNSRWLFEKGWNGVYIEGDAKKFKDLVKNYQKSPEIKCVHAFLGAPRYGLGEKNLATILKDEKIDPATITFVSIDVDGMDLEIFLDLGFKPPVVLIEGGSNFSPRIEKPISREIALQNLQQPLGYIVSEIKNFGYTPVCFFQDVYAIRDDLAAPSRPALRAPSNSTKMGSTLWKIFIAITLWI